MLVAAGRATRSMDEETARCAIVETMASSHWRGVLRSYHPAYPHNNQNEEKLARVERHLTCKPLEDGKTP